MGITVRIDCMASTVLGTSITFPFAQAAVSVSPVSQIMIGRPSLKKRHTTLFMKKDTHFLMEKLQWLVMVRHTPLIFTWLAEPAYYVLVLLRLKSIEANTCMTFEMQFGLCKQKSHSVKTSFGKFHKNVNADFTSFSFIKKQCFFMVATIPWLRE